MFLNTKEYSSFWLNGKQYSKGFLNGKQIFGDVYDAATLAIIAAANSKGYALPTNLTPLDNLIKNLKTISSGAFWNSRDSIHLSAIAGNSTAHHGLRKLNLKNPSGQERVFYGGLSLNSYGGIQGNGTNAYIDHVTAITTYTNYKQNDAGIIVVKSTDASGIVTLRNDTSTICLLGGMSSLVNRINSTAGSNFDYSGLGTLGLSRNNSESYNSYINATQRTVTATSVAMTAKQIREFTIQDTSLYYAGDELVILTGASYTQAELNLFRTYFNQYLTESGFSAIA